VIGVGDECGDGFPGGEAHGGSGRVCTVLHVRLYTIPPI
jgi:hypothetical protein